MGLLGAALTGVLVAAAALHTAWSLGIWWPWREERALVRAVVGVAGAERMPGPIPCALVAAVSLLAASVPWWPDGWMRSLGLAVAAFAFLARGAMAWARPWRRVAAQEPFASLDRAVYGPLFLAMGAGFAALLLG